MKKLLISLVLACTAFSATAQQPASPPPFETRKLSDNA